MTYLELEELYDKNGVCYRRSINGVVLPSDTHPSIAFTCDDIKNAKFIRMTKYMTMEMAKNLYNYSK